MTRFCVRWHLQIWWRFGKRCSSDVCLHSVAQSVRDERAVRALPTCWVAICTSSTIPLSTVWRFCRVQFVLEPNPPARRKSRQQWKRGRWATSCEHGQTIPQWGRHHQERSRKHDTQHWMSGQGQHVRNRCGNPTYDDGINWADASITLFDKGLVHGICLNPNLYRGMMHR